MKTPKLAKDSLYLTSSEVAEWIRVSPSTLCRWRRAGRGPRVTWLSEGCPRYRRADVETWLREVAAWRSGESRAVATAPC